MPVTTPNRTKVHPLRYQTTRHTKKDIMTPQLICTCWTSAGNVAPDHADQTSPISLDERISLISQTGWSGMGLAHADLIKARETIGYESLSRKIKDAGIGIVEVEFLNGWWATGAVRKVSDKVRSDLFAASRVLVVPTIKVVDGTGQDG